MPPAAAAAAVRQQLRQQQQKLEQTAPVEARLRAVKSVARGGGTVEMQAQRRRQQHQQQQRRTGVGGALWEAWPAAEDEAAAAAALLGDGDVEGLGSDGWKRPQQHRRSVSEDGVELARGGRRTGGGMHALNDSPRSPLSAFAAAFPLLSPQPLPPAAGGLATAAAGRPTALRSPSDHSSTSPSDSPPFLRLHGGSGAGSSPAAPPSYFLPDDRTYKIGGGTGHNSSFHLTAQSSNGGSFADSKGVTVDAGLLLLSPRSASNGGGGLGGGSGWGSASSSVAVGSPIRAVSLEVVHVSCGRGQERGREGRARVCGM